MESVYEKYCLYVLNVDGHLLPNNEWNTLFVLHRYIPTVKMFVDRNMIDVMFVLDDESREDHTSGDCLQRHNFTVKYEALPEFTKRGIPLPGYDRQQWSTFYMDQLSNSDYIGVIDADGMIFSFMHPFYSIFASNDDKRIILKPMHGDHYIDDKVILDCVFG